MPADEHTFRHFRNVESAQVIITETLESVGCIFKERDACRSCGHEVHYRADICPICNTKVPHSTIYGHLAFYDAKFFKDARAKRRRIRIYVALAMALLAAMLLCWLLFRLFTAS
jgi:RNA polymerase subunit RPABC4/transcription elongation factor Spt4